MTLASAVSAVDARGYRNLRLGQQPLQLMKRERHFEQHPRYRTNGSNCLRLARLLCLVTAPDNSDQTKPTDNLTL